MATGFLEVQRTTREANITEALRLRGEGVPLAEIAETLGVALSTASLWSSEYAMARSREKRLGRRVEPRVCVGYACRVVIPASERANKTYCSKACWARTKSVRQAAR